MQIRCYHCHRPFALGTEAVFQALDTLEASGLGHYNVICPHCRRTNRISRQELLHAAPRWTPRKEEEHSTQDRQG